MSRSRIRFPAELPISARVADIAAAVEANQVVIVAGATGSGKTTQLPKILLDMGRGTDGLIGVTQPRRIAATSVAARVASELECELGMWLRRARERGLDLGRKAIVLLVRGSLALANGQLF